MDDDLQEAEARLLIDGRPKILVDTHRKKHLQRDNYTWIWSFEMSTTNELIDAYLAGPAKLRAGVAGMTPEQLRARPVPGKWSTLEVVAHIGDFEPVYADRIRRVIALKKPLLLTADEDAYASSLAYHERDLEEELAFIEATRKSTARILRSIPAESWTRVGVHSEKGLVTLEQLVSAITGHIPHHLKFVVEKRAALGLN